MRARVRRRTLMVGATSVTLLSACGRDSASEPRPAVGNASAAGSPAEPNAYRRSARHVKHPCNACRSHNRSRYYATREAAAADQPHPGCSCDVRGQVIATAAAAGYFADGRTTYDARSG